MGFKDENFQLQGFTEKLFLQGGGGGRVRGKLSEKGGLEQFEDLSEAQRKREGGVFEGFDTPMHNTNLQLQTISKGFCV